MHDRLIQGPRVKTEETRLLERMIQGILEEQAAGRKIAVNYNTNGEMIVLVGAASYNLTEIFKYYPDWEQLEFTPTDIARFTTFLNDPTTKYQQHPGLNQPAIRNQFPNLQLAELDAIRNYTGEFYTAINHLLRSNGTQEFPNPSSLAPGEFKTALKKFLQGGAVNLNQLVTEALLNSAISASALSKPIQDQMQLCTVPSIDVLMNKIDEVKGISIVLIGNGDEREFAIVAYGKIITKSPRPKVSLSKLLDPAIGEGLELNATQIQILNDALKSPPDYQKIAVNNMLKARLFARMRAVVGAHYFNPQEELFRVDRHNPYMNAYVGKVVAGINAQDMEGSLQAPPGFSSTSAGIQGHFLRNQPGIITHLQNRVGDWKNIQNLSKLGFELERLGIPGRELLYLNHQNNLAADPHIHLYAESVRSLNRIEAQTEAEEKILAAAKAEIMAVFAATEKKKARLFNKAQKVMKQAINGEINLTKNPQNKAGMSKKYKQALSQIIEAIEFYAILKISEIESTIAAVAAEGIAEIEQITANVKKEVSLAAKARQESDTKNVTTELVQGSNEQNYTCKLFKAATQQVAQSAAEELGIKCGSRG